MATKFSQKQMPVILLCSKGKECVEFLVFFFLGGWRGEVEVLVFFSFLNKDVPFK